MHMSTSTHLFDLWPCQESLQKAFKRVSQVAHAFIVRPQLISLLSCFSTVVASSIARLCGTLGGTTQELYSQGFYSQGSRTLHDFMDQALKS